MSYPYSLVKTAVTGDLLAASDYNTEHQNHINNNDPASINDASANVAAMQTTVSPGGVGTESLAIDLAGELQRLRYALNRIVGKGTQWYDAPETNLHTLFGAAPAFPGVMVDYAGTSAPSGWLVCDGSAVSRSSYASLFTAIGTTWGVGDGSTTFNIPNMARRTSVGSGGSSSATLSNTVSSTGGVETATTTGHTHTANSHTHSISHQHKENIVGAVGGGNYTQTAGEFGTVANSGTKQVSTFAAFSSAGVNSYFLTSDTQTANSGTASDTGMTTVTDTVSTIQPSAVVLKIIKT